MQWDLHIKSTPDERYNGIIDEHVERVFKDNRVKVIEHYGGTALGEWAGDDQLTSDNGWVFETDEMTARRIEQHLQRVTGRPVRVHKMPNRNGTIDKEPDNSVPHQIIHHIEEVLEAAGIPEPVVRFEQDHASASFVIPSVQFVDGEWIDQINSD